MRLPSYMAPRSVQVVDQLPVTANGKIDRTRLLQLATRPTVVAAPRGEVPDAVRAH
jgi:acyl-coenzyme A synthetase/AMP-(fatty) acid ligase